VVGTMTLTINGERRDVGDARTVADLLERLGVRRNGTAVAINDRVIPSSTLSEHSLADGDAVEIIVAVAGG